MIQTVRMSDAGEYSVVAGSSVSKAQLTVEGKDVRISEPVEKEVTVNICLHPSQTIMTVTSKLNAPVFKLWFIIKCVGA